MSKTTNRFLRKCGRARFKSAKSGLLNNDLPAVRMVLDHEKELSSTVTARSTGSRGRSAGCCP